MKTDIIYTNDVLMVNITGDILEQEYKKLKKKVNYIMSEYQINDIILDLKNSKINDLYLEDLINSFSNVIIKR